MAKESSLRTFPIDLFVKGGYYGVKILHKWSDCIALIGYWSEIIFIISLKKKLFFAKFFETSFGSNILASFIEFQCERHWYFWFYLVILFFTFHINNGWILLLKVDEQSFLMTSEINMSH